MIIFKKITENNALVSDDTVKPNLYMMQVVICDVYMSMADNDLS